MKAQSNLHHPGETTESHPVTLLTGDQARVMGALMLIGTGIFFSLAFAGRASWSSPWWVMYIAIPSVMLLFAAASALLQTSRASSPVMTNGVLGLLGLVLSWILIFDPTWSFTHGWITLPFFRGPWWNLVWQWAIVFVGALALGKAIQLRNVGAGIFGVLLLMTGGTFLLNLSWDSVWPLMIVVIGVGLLFQFGRKK